MPLCEAVDRSGAVFVDTANEIVGDTGIKCPVLSRGEYVDIMLQGSIIARPWIPDQVRDDDMLLAARSRFFSNSQYRRNAQTSASAG